MCTLSSCNRKKGWKLLNTSHSHSILLFCFIMWLFWWGVRFIKIGMYVDGRNFTLFGYVLQQCMYIYQTDVIGGKIQSFSILCVWRSVVDEEKAGKAQNQAIYALFCHSYGLSNRTIYYQDLLLPYMTLCKNVLNQARNRIHGVIMRYLETCAWRCFFSPPHFHALSSRA